MLYMYYENILAGNIIKLKYRNKEFVNFNAFL